MRKTVKMTIVLLPHAQASILVVKDVPAITGGGGDTDYACGGCGVVLIEGGAPPISAPVQSLLKCAKCGVYNNIPT